MFFGHLWMSPSTCTSRVREERKGETPISRGGRLLHQLALRPNQRRAADYWTSPASQHCRSATGWLWFSGSRWQNEKPIPSWNSTPYSDQAVYCQEGRTENIKARIKIWNIWEELFHRFICSYKSDNQIWYCGNRRGNCALHVLSGHQCCSIVLSHPFQRKPLPILSFVFPADVHHSLHINHQSVAPFSPPPALNLFTFRSFPFLYRESRLIRRSLDLIFIKGLGEGEDLVMTIIFHIWNRDKG